MLTTYNLSTNLSSYTILFNGWIGKHNIEGDTPATTHPDFVSWLINGVNTGSLEFDVEHSDEDLHIEFYGQEVIDQAPFFIGERGNEARGFKLIAHQVISYTIEEDEEPTEVITNDLLELIELIEDNEDLFLSHLSCYGIEPDDRATSEQATSTTFTYRFHNCSDVSDVLSTIENQLYGTLADTLLEWTQWYDEWSFTDSHTIDDEGSLTFTWTYTHPPIPKPRKTILTAV
jgi:hypothetical protein